MDGTKYNQRFQIESSDIEPTKWENQKILSTAAEQNRRRRGIYYEQSQFRKRKVQ